jgi:hypothetical protein
VNPDGFCRCDWREVFSIDLLNSKRSWKSLHLFFSMYKYEEKKGKHLYGFSYLPFASEGETILPDKIYKATR